MSDFGWSKCLQTLADKGNLRQLDYQFARWMLEQGASEPLAFIAALLSSELGKGHICLPLHDSQGQAIDAAQKLGLYADAALELRSAWLSQDWSAELQQSPLVSADGNQALPLVFDGNRLYLNRYWHYELHLSERLLSFGTPMSLKPTDVQKLSELLDHLFARDYSFLFSALKQGQVDGKDTQVVRQQKVCDMLDVVASEQLDWQAIDQVLTGAQRAQDLTALEQLVPASVCVNWQKVAAAMALTRRFAVISGGPGTGKTTTVAKLLAALVEQSRQMGDTPSIKLVAPTGKAAARLTESIGKAVESLPISPELKQQIPTESSTLHRLLGVIPGSAEFRHHHDNPLHLDILVIDEASMVDLSMMYKVVDALPKHARLILLGDKDQLSSVEAGAVLGDICSFHALGYSAEQGERLAKLTGYQSLTYQQGGASHIADSLCVLQKSYRFDARSGIGQLAKAVNAGDGAKIDAVYQQDFSDIEHFALNSQHYNQMIQTLVGEYRRYLECLKPEQLPIIGVDNGQLGLENAAKEALNRFNQCRLLCAIREGDFGVSGLNLRIEKALAARRLIHTQDELWYHGRPIMVTRNDHGLGLYNGDIGICIREPGEGGRLKVYFEQSDGSIKSVLPSRVPEHETAFAMTIHKSQGSEFDFTLMILPPDFTPLVTRELIYTGITRAKKRLAIYADIQLMKRGVKIRTERASGLVDRLS